MLVSFFLTSEMLLLSVLCQGSLLRDSKSRRSCLCSLLPTALLLCLVFFIGSAFIATDYKEKLTRLRIADSMQDNTSNMCKNQFRPYGSEPLPKGIISKASNLEMRPLWGSLKEEKKSSNFTSLFAIAAGIKQKDNVNQMIKKFLSCDSVIMIFHYDGVVDGWNDLEWYYRAIHVSAFNQTKWWFAKRFLHPDIVAEYNYIFLWDEDLGVENFDPLRYLTIVDEEGLEISQPALDTAKSEVHHQLTARGRRSRVHRRIYKSRNGVKCDGNSTGPPCTGWVEMMAPVFSRKAWRCTWYMIQNDLIHAWGMDKEMGYCAQGDRTKNVGIVDAEYIVHQGLPTLGGLDESKTPPGSHGYDDRMQVRLQSYKDLAIFKHRWKKAVEEDECWVDPYLQTAKA
ncbi:hypothetical protein AQUCO_05800129v1 [Aquilegia coerulea]|uniref:Uncharacterized protein n=1 Tax=Aquilegia coerulea TaxID=218851 RepID=A0A2G5CEW2_AQUCA|nr:hypothetical protein AQUCO_05800129v1 [Aquilegia coerulea]